MASRISSLVDPYMVDPVHADLPAVRSAAVQSCQQCATTWPPLGRANHGESIRRSVASN